MLHHKAFIEKARSVYNAGVAQGCGFLFYMDIDEFHVINEFYGIDGGDSLLQAVDDFVNQFSTVEVCERVFSDQFVFLLVTAEPQNAQEICELFQTREEELLNAQRKNYPNCNLRISCGIYTLREDNIDEAIEGANLARKVAKRQGTNTPVVYGPEMTEMLHETQKRTQEIRQALNNRQFTFFLQQKVDFVTGEIIGAEALARCINDKGQVIYPDSFIDIMEENGMIVELDLQILRQVCEFLADRIRQGKPVVITSVNLSRMHIQNPRSAWQLHNIVLEYKIPASMLEFELTESILLNEFSGAKKLIDELHDYGYRVSIDDFGSGYNSIRIWQELDFDVLKLDKKFLSEDQELRFRNAAIVPNVINIAQRLNIDVLCEGVETVAQCHYLMKLGCTTIQGYYFSRPVTKEEFYQTYEELNGFHKSSVQQIETVEEPAVQEAEEPKVRSKNKKRVKKGNIKILLSIILVLTVSGVLAFGLNYRFSLSMFKDSICENLNAYTLSQNDTIDARIDEITNTMGAFSDLIEKNQDEQTVDDYIKAMGANDPEVTFQFLPAGDARWANMEPSGGMNNETVLGKISQGDRVVTDIYYSDTARDYCFAIGYPVFADGKFIGALRAIVNAGMLVSTEQYNISPYGSAILGIITDEDDTILLSSSKNTKTGENAVDYLQEQGAQLTDGQLFSDEAQSNCIGEKDGVSYYISSIALDYNGWHRILIFKADAAVGLRKNISSNSYISIIIAALGVLMAAALFILQQKKLQKKLDEETRRYALLAQFSDTVLFQYDLQTDSMHFTPNYKSLLNLRDINSENFVKDISNTQHTYFGDVSAISDMLQGRMQDVKQELRIRIKAKDGKLRWCLITFKYLYTEDGTVDSVIGKIVDIDDNYRKEAQLVQEALRDGLTGLYNHTTVIDLVTQALQTDKSGLMFMIDIDDFKQINDRYGHDKGNYFLRVISNCLLRCFRSEDIIGRVGGDELLVYARKADGLDVVQKKMQMFYDMLSEDVQDSDITLSVSVGAASMPADGIDYEELFHTADQAMYQAKRKGKNRYCYEGEVYQT